MSRFKLRSSLVDTRFLMFKERIFGVFKLETGVFEAISHDPDSIIYAGLVIALVASLKALGNGTSTDFLMFRIRLNFLLALAWSFMSWFLWTGILYVTGRLFATRQPSYKQLLSLTGFAYAPQALAILPWIGALAGLTWSLAACFVGVRQGMSIENRKMALIFIISLVAYSSISLLSSLVPV